MYRRVGVTAYRRGEAYRRVSRNVSFRHSHVTEETFAEFDNAYEKVIASS